MLGHARQLGHAAQLHLAPAATHLGPAQRLGQRGRLATQRLLALDHRRELLLQAAVGLPPRPLGLVDRRGRRRQLLLNRPHQRRHSLLPLSQRRVAAIALALQGRLGQLQKLLVAVTQRLGRERPERLGQLIVGRVEAPLGVGQSRMTYR